MRTWQELEAAASATGTFDQYHGDGATVPYEMTAAFSALAGLALWQYKEHLDASYPAAFKLHDWCYTPYGQLIGVSREEADEALAAQILAIGGPTSSLDSDICFWAVRTGGGPWFGNSQTGFDQGLFNQVTSAIWEFQTMPFYKLTVGLNNKDSNPPTGFSETWSFSASSDTVARNQVADYVSERAKVLSKSWQVGTFLRLSRYQTNCRRFKPQGTTKYCCVPRMESRIRCVCPAPITGKQPDGDQGWDGLKIELCTEPYAHVGCSKCQANAAASTRQWIMRGMWDDFYKDNKMNLTAAQKNDITTFAQTYIIGKLKAGIVACNDACDDSSSASCTAAVFAPFTHACPDFDKPRKRDIGRPFGLYRGRRSKRKTAT
jgi:hypothetical protein